MRFAEAIVAACAAAAAGVAGSYVPVPNGINDALVPRALPDNPSGSYAPSQVDCPSDAPSIRSAASLSPQEQAWLQVRRNNTLQPMKDLLGRIAIPGFDAVGYINSHQNNVSAIPNIAVAMSGGGYRAMFVAAGIFAAFDSRSPNSTGRGQLGGLLQASTYLSALSGGNWMVGSLFTNNFTSVTDILGSNSQLWDISRSILEGPPQKLPSILGVGQYFTKLFDQVSDKKDASFNTSITDYWGRALSYQLVNAPDGGPDFTFSSIQDQEFFKNGSTPLPLIVADGRAPGERLISVNTTIYEFNPWEVGSFDPIGPFGFAPLRYAGSNFSNGRVVPNQKCIRGFDNVGFVMGTSSSLFNQFILQINGTGIPKVFQDVITSFLKSLDEDDDDISDWTPNPFFGYNNKTNLNAQSHRLTMVDGGEDGQNIPLHPVIQPERKVDVIFAVDSSADSKYFWPDGTSIIATYRRSLNQTIENGTAFPAIPDNATFINSGLNIRPTFFGCNASNSSYNGQVSPLIVYLPSSYYSYQANTSTFQLSYNNTQRDAIIQNSWNVATQGNGTVNSDWNVCVGCAILSRSLDRTGTRYPDACNTCFQKYCWNGAVNSTKPNESIYDEKNMTALINSVSSSASDLRAPQWMVLAGAAFLGSLFTML